MRWGSARLLFGLISLLLFIQAAVAETERPKGVCPPFHLRDEQGRIIDPINGVNASAPYSPRQTCGAAGCHDYEKITRGYHFTQGQGEPPTDDQRARLAWVTSPGNVGGSWCSPAPLYRYLSPKHNDSPARMDMTAFDFFTSTCASCHPGGGSAEFDRSGRRYDTWMADPASGLSPGAANGFDGDYYKARWSETGVLEADCLLCHLPGYDLTRRVAQISAWNLRWAASAGARLAVVEGAVKDGQPVRVTYDPQRFEKDGTPKLVLAVRPRNGPRPPRDPDADGRHRTRVPRRRGQPGRLAGHHRGDGGRGLGAGPSCPLGRLPCCGGDEAWRGIARSRAWPVRRSSWPSRTLRPARWLRRPPRAYTSLWGRWPSNWEARCGYASRTTARSTCAATGRRSTTAS
jgi:hypothetical protein